MTHCSDALAEPLAGTAKRAEVFVLFEWTGGWSRDVLDGRTFPPALSKAIKKKTANAAFQLIRRPGREGHTCRRKYRCFVVWPRHGLVQRHLLDGPHEILDLDLETPRGARIPLMLVCTHAKRDMCCAVKGRPLAAALEEEFGEAVWEASHLKGHRFAPAVLLMPWGYSFGRLNAEAGGALMRAAYSGEMFLAANRGSCLHPPRGQVAELAVARLLVDAAESPHYGDLTVGIGAGVEPVAVRHRDGREWLVELEKKEVPGVITSCGDKPKTSTALVATGVRRV